MAAALIDAVRARTESALTRALRQHRGTIPPRVVVEAGRLGWQRGLALLHAQGADLNASYKNYRALHALIQEKPHEGNSSTPERTACLTWMVAHGADPELTAAWPPARAVIVAAFTGELAYVQALKDGGAKADIFTAAALGDRTRVRARLARETSLAAARDEGGLTVLQCAAGSRLGGHSRPTAARLLDVARCLLDAGADARAQTRSWGHDVDAAYLAISSGQLAMLEMLLDAGVDPTAALAPAVWKIDLPAIDLLLARGARLDRARDGSRPLLNEMVRWGQFTQARLLLARGASPNIADGDGWTALHQAASRGNLAILDDLLAAGADPQRRDAAGQMPIDVARAKRRPKLAERLAT